MELVKKGQKFITIKEFPSSVLTTWFKPYTGSEDCIIPKGTIFIAEYDQRSGYPGFGVLPEKYKEMEPFFIPPQILENKDYSNYYFVFNKKDYGKYFVYLDEYKNEKI